jgi:hypothetical protein
MTAASRSVRSVRALRKAPPTIPGPLVCAANRPGVPRLARGTETARGPRHEFGDGRRDMSDRWPGMASGGVRILKTDRSPVLAIGTPFPGRARFRDVDAPRGRARGWDPSSTLSTSRQRELRAGQRGRVEVSQPGTRRLPCTESRAALLPPKTRDPTFRWARPGQSGRHAGRPLLAAGAWHACEGGEAPAAGAEVGSGSMGFVQRRLHLGWL